MKRPTIQKEQVTPVFESKYIKVFDLEYAKGSHYLTATRRSANHLVATKSRDEFQNMLPDAVTCIVIIKCTGMEPQLLLSHEYRYPTGQFLLSPPAGLIDKEDTTMENPLITTAIRELYEETGIVFENCDTAKIVNPLLFSTPGMTDESNALVLIELNRDTMPSFTTTNTVGSECFDGFTLLNKEEARKILENGTDSEGIYYSVYTFACLMYFLCYSTISGTFRTENTEC